MWGWIKGNTGKVGEPLSSSFMISNDDVKCSSRWWIAISNVEAGRSLNHLGKKSQVTWITPLSGLSNCWNKAGDMSYNFVNRTLNAIVITLTNIPISLSLQDWQLSTT